MLGYDLTKKKKNEDPLRINPKPELSYTFFQWVCEKLRNDLFIFCCLVCLITVLSEEIKVDV